MTVRKDTSQTDDHLHHAASIGAAASLQGQLLIASPILMTAAFNIASS